MDSVDFLFIVEVEVHQFGVVVHACAGRQENDDFGGVHLFLKEVDEEVHFL
jgi:hypothetical protein